MHRIDFYFQKGQNQFKRSLTANGTLVLGRQSSEAVEIELPSDWTTISRKHCSFEWVDGQCIVQDLNSANGTFVDDVKLSPGAAKAVRLPVEIRLGTGADAVHLRVKKSSADQAPNTPNPSRGNTLISNLGSKNQITIGRSPECDLVLKDAKVSRKHARFFQKNGKYYIEDLGSTNGTFVNNARITGAREFTINDTLYIGLNALKLKDVARNLSSETVIAAEGIAKIFANGNRGLHSTTLTVERAEMVAIMGPSGSGKSTLLKLLNGEIALTHGILKIYGLDLLEHKAYLSAHMGYVPQDDIIHRDLTVEQTLRYAARIRLPSDLNKNEIRDKIKSVLQMVSLDEPKLMQTRVRELSGGQRKRVSIAVELLNDPKLLFLDEPTSPLDPETIDEFLKCLKNLTDNGTTVLMVTHKPEDLAYMDRVVFIGTGGYHAYTGRPDEMPRYFKVESIINVYKLLSDTREGKVWHERISKDRSGPPVKAKTGDVALKKNHLAQLYWQTSRYLKVKLGNPTNIWIILLQPLIIGLLVSVTFDEFRETSLLQTGSLTQIADVGLIFLISLAAVWFGVSLSAKEIVSERAIYNRERKMRLTPLVYILSKQIVLSTLLLIQLIIFVFTLLVKYGDSFHLPIESIAFLFFLGSASILFGMALSTFANSAESVMSILPIALMPQIILSGIVSPVKSPLMEVLSYLTFGRWGTEGLARLQDTSADGSGLFMIEQQLYSNDAMKWCQGLGENVFAIGLLAVVFFVLVIVKLYAQDKTV